jgi:hypothetical protein
VVKIGENFDLCRESKIGQINIKTRLHRCGGVAQWTSHPPQEQEDKGLNPARV